MKILNTYINGVLEIELDCHKDERGFFMEIYNEESFKKLGINNRFVQDNCSFSSKKGTIRGLHFQKEPYAQAKLIRCSKGAFFDLAVDLRKGSPTFGKAAAIKLEENDHKLILIPRGFAHGVAILKDGSEYNYKVDNVYNGQPENNGGISYDYDSTQLNWDQLLPGVQLVLSERDQKDVSKTLEECDTNFVYLEENNG